MKVYIGPYPNWYTRSDVIRFICNVFRIDCEDARYGKVEDWVYDSKVIDFCVDLANKCRWRREQKVKVRIDNYDAWSADYTLAHIILPLLKKVQEGKQGSPFTDDEDVPEELRSNNGTKENEWDIDSLHHKRWEYVIGEMIFAFENIVDTSWEEKFHSGETKYDNIEREDGFFEIVEAPDSTGKFDFEGYKAYGERIENGTRLFGKYYQALWT